MFPVLLADVLQYVFGILMGVTGLFLILLVLVQRGRGGGLAGALGGMGGQSAFGTKAGDTFTKVTVGAASIWILLCISAVWVLGRQSNKLGSGAAPPANTSPLNESTAPPAETTESGAPSDTGEGADFSPGTGVDAAATDSAPATTDSAPTP